MASGCGGSKREAGSPAPVELKPPPPPEEVEVGKPAPALSVKTVNGKGNLSLESLSGKIVVVDFWATWCGPCKQSLPKLESLAKQNAGNVEFVGISVDDQVDGVADFAKANGASFAIGWDEGHSIANRWKVDTMPTTYVVDGTGKIRFIHAGYHDDEPAKIAKELTSLASESPSASKVAASDKTDKSDTKTDTKSNAKPDSKGDTAATARTTAATTDASKSPKKQGAKNSGKKPPSKKTTPKTPAKPADKTE